MSTGYEYLLEEVRPRKRRGLRILFGCIVILLLLAVLAGMLALAWVRHAMRASLPQLDGEIHLSGLSSPVTVRRDVHGVPHIEAATLDDLLFAQGYVTAQDRLWQMDILRRYAAGETAEVLGKGLIEHDRYQRVLGFRKAAEAAIANTNARDLRQLEQYARGVNAYMEQAQNNLPAEFLLLRYKPRPWRPVDSIIVSLNIHADLETSFTTKLNREKIAAKLSPEMVADLYPVGSWRDHPPVTAQPDLTQPQPDIPEIPLDESQSKLRLAAPLELLQSLGFVQAAAAERCRECIPGSNNWVISGAHSTNGKPVLANDMHLGHSIPNTWYEAHLKAGDLNVAGVTLPGVPLVVAGHNQHIAWGFTNISADVQDVYVEQVNAQGQYQTPDGWRPVEHATEHIHVKGGADVVVDVARTGHGPIITPVVPGETRTLSLSWTAYDPQAVSLSMFDLDYAQNWDEFRAACANWGSPEENTVYADDQGNIGYQAIGRVPLRPGGLIEVPITDTQHEWNGYIPFEHMPSALNPPGGILATANSRVTEENTQWPLTLDWGPPYRNERIWKWLGARERFTPDEMLTLQTDVYSDLDHGLAQRFAYAIDHAAKPDARVKQAADLMRSWDGRVEVDSVAAAIVVGARHALWQLVLEPRLGAQWKQYVWEESPFAQEEMVTHEWPRWLPPGYSNWNELLTAAVEKALADKHAPLDLAGWRYGDLYPVEIQHPVFGQMPFLKKWTGTGIHPQSGDGVTVKQVERSFGPSQRLTVNFADLDASTLNIVMGQSGNPLSEYYRDQWAYWYEGRTFPLPFSDSAVRAAATHTLTLTPQ